MDLESEMALKLELMLEGMRIEEPALEGVGTIYNENINFLFDYNLDLKPGTLPPNDLKFPSGSVVNVNYNLTSPYCVKKEDATLILEKEGRFLTTVEWTRRPAFYERLTSDGIKMKEVAQIMGECAFFICYSFYCSNWQGGNQCRFCNLNASHRGIPPEEVFLTQKKADQYAEVATAALDEGIDLHFKISGGTLPGTKAEDAVIMALEALKRHTGLKQVPGYANISAPADLSQIDRIQKTGISSIVIDLEVWNPHIFKAICPGKARGVGRENFLRALEYAVSVFGKGHVWTALVMGLEEKENYFEAAEYLAERGICVVMSPWIPVRGSKLEGHRPPRVDWMLEVNSKVVDICARAMPVILSEEFFGSGVLECHRCNTINLFWDEARRSRGSNPL